MTVKDFFVLEDTEQDIGNVQVNAVEQVIFRLLPDTVLAMKKNDAKKYNIKASCGCSSVSYNKEKHQLEVNYIPQEFTDAQLKQTPDMESYRTTKFIKATVMTGNKDNPELEVQCLYKAEVFEQLFKNMP